MLLTHKEGKVTVWQYGVKRSELDLSKPPLSININTEGDLGVVSCAIHPNGWVYIAYVHNTTVNRVPIGASVVGRFRLTEDNLALDPSSMETVIGKCPGPNCMNCIGRTHCINQLHIGPDLMLYIAMGENNVYEGSTWLDTDGQPAHIPNNGSNVGPMDVYNFEGKILRIDPETGLGLSDNPWAYSYPFPGFSTTTSTTRTTKTTSTKTTKTSSIKTTKTTTTKSTKSTTSTKSTSTKTTTSSESTSSESTSSQSTSSESTSSQSTSSTSSQSTSSESTSSQSTSSESTSSQSTSSTSSQSTSSESTSSQSTSSESTSSQSTSSQSTSSQSTSSTSTQSTSSDSTSSSTSTQSTRSTSSSSQSTLSTTSSSSTSSSTSQTTTAEVFYVTTSEYESSSYTTSSTTTSSETTSETTSSETTSETTSLETPSETTSSETTVESSSSSEYDGSTTESATTQLADRRRWPGRKEKRQAIVKRTSTTTKSTKKVTITTTKTTRRITTPKPSWVIPADQQNLAFGADWRSKVYMSGLRNPWTFAFADNSSQPDLVVADVGWAYVEALKQGSAGWNLGWPCTEGRNFSRQVPGWGNVRRGCFGIGSLYPQVRQKVLVQWDHMSQSSAIIGLARMGNIYPSAYRGSWMYGDYVRGTMNAYREQNNRTISLGTYWGSPIRLKTGPDGLIYVLEGYTNTVRRIQPKNWVPVVKSRTTTSRTTSSVSAQSTNADATPTANLIRTSTTTKPAATYCNPPINTILAGQLSKLPEINPLSSSAFSSVVYLSQIPPSNGQWVPGTQRWPTNGGGGPAEMDSNNGRGRANDGVPMTINGRRFVKGVGVHVSSVGMINVNGYCTRFLASVGVDDLTAVTSVRGQVRFMVIRGETGAILYDSSKRVGNIQRGQSAIDVSVDISGVRNLTLMAIRPAGVSGTTPGMDVNWADARIACGIEAPFVPVVTLNRTNPLMAKIGETVTLHASAVDFKGTRLPPSSIGWEIFLTHCQGAGCHVHPGGSWQGQGSLDVLLLDHADCITYTARATATDACGRTGWATWHLRVETAEACCRTGGVGCSATTGINGIPLDSTTPLKVQSLKAIPKELAADGRDHLPGDLTFFTSSE